MASTLRALNTLVHRSFTTRALFQQHGVRRLYSTTNVRTKNLLKIVEKEIGLEQAMVENLPKISSFQLTINNSMATLLRMFNGEEVKVQLDANSAVEVSSDEMDSAERSNDEDEDEDSEYEDTAEPFSVPTFTVTVKNESGTTLQFDCSFDDFGPYNKGIADVEWDCMRIDSVSVVPEDREQVESIYSATGSSLSEEMYHALLEFLKERGINEMFAKQILQFYRVFEHQCYVKDFLGGVQRFCEGK